jgi:hypothetical protein
LGTQEIGWTKGENPRKVGSLVLRDPLISSFFDTLWYQERKFSFGKMFFPKVRKRKKT